MSKRANGEGSVYYDKQKGKWKGQYIVGYKDDGKPIRKSVFGKTKTEAKDKLKQVELGVYSGEFIDKSTITIKQLAQQLFDDDFNDGIIKENTYRTNCDTLKRLATIYNTPLQKVTEMQIKDYLLKEQNYSQSVINKDFILLKRTLKAAVKKGIIKESPMAEMRKPKSRKKTVKVRALTIEEQSKIMSLLAHGKIRYSEQMLLSMLTGMRMGEVNALKVNDINFVFNTISVSRTISRKIDCTAMIGDDTKTKAGIRYINFDDDVKRLLQKCITAAGNNELLFTKNNDGKTLISTSMVNEVLHRALKKYDILDLTVKGKVTDHSFRHTYATRCIEAGVPATVLQKLLGHEDISTTLNTYCDVFDQFKETSLALVTQHLKTNGLTLESIYASDTEAGKTVLTA